MEDGSGRFRAVLEAKRAELDSRLQHRDGIAIERSGDQLDEMQQTAERELAVRNLHRWSDLLRNVRRSALRRLDEGTFGRRVQSDEDINLRRLEAVPGTPFCLRCQQAADRGDERAAEALRDLLEAA